MPAPFPPADLVIDCDLLIDLGDADRALARLDGAVSMLPAIDHFNLPYIFLEATTSSQIEGTQATRLHEALFSRPVVSSKAVQEMLGIASEADTASAIGVVSDAGDPLDVEAADLFDNTRFDGGSADAAP